jgi:hypothetical protein
LGAKSVIKDAIGAPPAIVSEVKVALPQTPMKYVWARLTKGSPRFLAFESAFEVGAVGGRSFLWAELRL